MSDIDPLKIDRDIARAARAERAFWRALRTDASRAAADAWFEPVRHVTTRTTFQEVAALPTSDPLRDALLGWIHRLALTRIAHAPILALAKARQEPTLRLEEPEPGLYALRAVVRRVIVDPERARARVWLEGLGAATSPLLAHEKALREATQEITARLGVADPDAFAPFDRAVVAQEAAQFLRRTDDLAGALFSRADDLAGLVAELVAKDVPGVWPTKPDARWLFDQFQGSPLLQGLTLDLGPTPAALGASSFGRALARFGAAYARSAVLGASFAVSSDPTDVHPLRRGALFASLTVAPVFLRKHLGLSRDAAGATARALGATFLAAARLSAMGATIDIVAASPAAIGEAVENALKVPVSPGLSGVFPRFSMRAAERFVASLRARADMTELESAFDEDWFRNPRGLTHLREVDAAPRPRKVANESILGSAEPLARALEAIAG